MIQCELPARSVAYNALSADYTRGVFVLAGCGAAQQDLTESARRAGYGLNVLAMCRESSIGILAINADAALRLVDLLGNAAGPVSNQARPLA